MKKLISGILILIAYTSCAQEKDSAASQIIKIASGSIRGITQNRVSIYKGIPFAAPPLVNIVGDLRNL